MDVARFLAIFPLIGLALCWLAMLIWRGKIPLFSADSLRPSTASLRVMRRYGASVPSMAVGFCLFLPAALFSHYGDVERNPALGHFEGIIQWPFWVLSILFILCGFSIQILGQPMRLIPPPMRTGSRLE
jgi:hypothetical protein